MKHITADILSLSICHIKNIEARKLNKNPIRSARTDTTALHHSIPADACIPYPAAEADDLLLRIRGLW